MKPNRWHRFDSTKRHHSLKHSTDPILNFECIRFKQSEWLIHFIQSIFYDATKKLNENLCELYLKCFQNCRNKEKCQFHNKLEENNCTKSSQIIWNVCIWDCDKCEPALISTRTKHLSGSEFSRKHSVCHTQTHTYVTPSSLVWVNVIQTCAHKNTAQHSTAYCLYTSLRHNNNNKNRKRRRNKETYERK